PSNSPCKYQVRGVRASPEGMRRYARGRGNRRVPVLGVRPHERVPGIGTRRGKGRWSASPAACSTAPCRVGRSLDFAEDLRTLPSWPWASRRLSADRLSSASRFSRRLLTSGTSRNPHVFHCWELIRLSRKLACSAACAQGVGFFRLLCSVGTVGSAAAYEGFP